MERNKDGTFANGHVSFNKDKKDFKFFIEKSCEMCAVKFLSYKCKNKRFCSKPCTDIWQTTRKIIKPKRKRYVHGGYIVILRPGTKKRRGYILEHRFIMEKHLKRKLKKTEHIHHINGIKHDNAISNLQILTNSEHARLHALQRGGIK